MPLTNLHPMHCSQEHPLHFTETEAITPNRTKSLGTVHSMHGLQKRGRVKFVCVVGNFFAIQAGIESARDFQGFSSLPSTPYSNRRVFRNGQPFCLFLLIDDSIQLHQLNTFLAELDGAGRTVVRAGLFSGVVGDALHPRHGQQVRALFEVRVAPLQILPLGEHCAQDAAFLASAAGLDGVQRHGGRVQACVVVGAVHTAAEGVMQQRLHVHGAVPRRGQVKVDAQMRPGDPEGRSGEGRRMDAGALVMQALPVDPVVVRPHPEADVAELPQADAAAHKMLVGVQDQVQQVLVGRHGQEAVHLHGRDAYKEVIQLVVGVLGGIEQVAVQLDVKRAVFFCVGHLVRRGQLVCRRVGGQAVCQQGLVAGGKLALRDEQVVVRADAVVPQGVEPAAKLPLHHDRVQPGIPEAAVEVGELRRAHGLVQHLSDDLLLDGREQRGVLPGGRRLADGLEEDGQQLLLVCQRENGRPVHVLRGQLPTGDGSLGDMQKLRFGGSQGHGRGPFLVFFHGVGQQQRCCADERPQRVADHVVRLRHAEGEAVLRVLDPRAEDAAGQRREADAEPSVPLSRQSVGQRQPQREEEEDVHQHLPVKLRLLPRGGEGGEGGEDKSAVPL